MFKSTIIFNIGFFDCYINMKIYFKQKLFYRFDNFKKKKTVKISLKQYKQLKIKKLKKVEKPHQSVNCNPLI